MWIGALNHFGYWIVGFQDKQFKKVVSDWWASQSIRGWGGYVLKEKVKEL